MNVRRFLQISFVLVSILTLLSVTWYGSGRSFQIFEIEEEYQNIVIFPEERLLTEEVFTIGIKNHFDPNLLFDFEYKYPHYEPFIEVNYPPPELYC